MNTAPRTVGAYTFRGRSVTRGAASCGTWPNVRPRKSVNWQEWQGNSARKMRKRPPRSCRPDSFASSQFSRAPEESWLQPPNLNLARLEHTRWRAAAFAATTTTTKSVVFFLFAALKWLCRGAQTLRLSLVVAQRQQKKRQQVYPLKSSPGVPHPSRLVVVAQEHLRIGKEQPPRRCVTTHARRRQQ